jgi:Zn-dependent protease
MMLPVAFDPALAISWYVVLIFSLTLHEAAHAWAAARGGDPTAYHAGQVSLDPRPHIRREPLGTIFMPLISFAMFGYMFGWASTPYDPIWAQRHPRRAAWMAAAGPAANLLLVMAAGLVIRGGMLSELFTFPEYINFSSVVTSVSPGLWGSVATLLSIAFALNLLLFVFNMIPVPPQDGSGAIGLLLSEETAARLQELMARPGIGLMGLLVAWLLIGEIFGPCFWLAIGLLYPEVEYSALVAPGPLA